MLFLVNCVILQDFEAVYNKVTAAYVVLIAWFGLKSWGCFVLEDNFLKVENSTLQGYSKIQAVCSGREAAESGGFD